MSAEEDTFEIDIYGDEHLTSEVKAEDSAPVNGHNSTGSGHYTASEIITATEQTASAEANEDEIDFDIKDEPSGETTPADLGYDNAQSQDPPAVQGTKRKAEEDVLDEHDVKAEQQIYEQPADDRPSEPGATTALKVADLHWWISEEDLRQFCAEANVESDLVELAFGEHKINGKSRGEAYLEFSSSQAAAAAKRAIMHAAQVKEENGVKKTPFTVQFTVGGNPFRTAQSSTGKKEFQQSNGRGGTYQNFNNQRGGFAGRGNFNNNARGNFNSNNNNMMQNRAAAPQQGGWGMPGMGAFGANPMMAAGYGNMAGMNGFGNMNRGGMMNGMGMMGRGGFPNMNMGMGMNMAMNMMGGGGRGGMMGGRGGGGGWVGAGAGNFQPGGGFNGGGGFGMQPQGGAAQQGGVNKRMKTGE